MCGGVSAGAGAASRPKGRHSGRAEILLHNVYRWFVRVERGVYSLSKTGKAAIILWKPNLPEPPADLPGKPQKNAVRPEGRSGADRGLEAILIKSGDLFANAAAGSGDEKISVIPETAGAKIEQIVSIGQASPAGYWHDQGSIELAFPISAAIHSKSPQWYRPMPGF